MDTYQNICCIKKEKYVNKYYNFSNCKAYFDFEKYKLHFCEDVKQNFKYCFLDFVRSLKDEKNVWQIVEFQGDHFIQSASFLFPNYC